MSAVHLVEDLKQLRSGKMITQQRGATPTQSGGGGASSMAMMMSKTSSSSSHSRVELHQHREQRAERERERDRDRERESHHHMHQRSSMEQYGIRAGVGVSGDDVAHISGETDSEHGGIGGGGATERDETSSTSSEKYERDVAVLNHCFDDIEKFIARLQHAAAASRELERRRRNRKSKKRDPGRDCSL